MENWCYFFLACLAWFPREAVWALSFPCGKVLTINSIFRVDIRSIQIICNSQWSQCILCFLVSSLDLCVYNYYQIWKLSAIISSNIFSVPSFLSSLGTPTTRISGAQSCPTAHCCSYIFKILFFRFSFSTLFSAVSSRLLIFRSVMPSLLGGRCLISDIVFISRNETLWDSLISLTLLHHLLSTWHTCRCNNCFPVLAAALGAPGGGGAVASVSFPTSSSFLTRMRWSPSCM